MFFMTGFEPFFDTTVRVLDSKGLHHTGILMKVESAKESRSGEEELALRVENEEEPFHIKCSEVLSFVAEW